MEFHTLRGGSVMRTGGETLRRRYYEAVALLEAEAKPQRELLELLEQVSGRLAHPLDICPTERWWRAELEQRWQELTAAGEISA